MNLCIPAFKKTKMLTLLFIFSVAILGACGKQEIQHIKADYAYYENSKEMVRFSDVIVVGKVLKDQQVEELNINSDKNRNPNLFIFTISDFEVREVLKGDIKPKETIRIKQIGGELKGKKLVAEGERYLQKDKEYILFLEYYRESEPLALINPTQGFIQLENEKTLTSSDNNVFSKGLDKNSFLSAIKTDIASINAEPKVTLDPKIRDQLLNK